MGIEEVSTSRTVYLQECLLVENLTLFFELLV